MYYILPDSNGLHAVCLPITRALTFDAAEIPGGVKGDEGIEGSLCPEEMCRVSEEFGAMDVAYTEQVCPRIILSFDNNIHWWRLTPSRGCFLQC